MQYIDKSFQIAATDLSNYLACKHLTNLDVQLAKKEIPKPDWFDPNAAILREKGIQHEKAYVDYLRSTSLTVEPMTTQSTQETIEAMARGVQVIVQGNIGNNEWVGRTDILIRVEGKSKFGQWSYEIQDTKLAQETRSGTILQLCVYSDLLTDIQGVPPKFFHVIKPGVEFIKESFLFSDFSAYYRLIKNSFQSELSNGIKGTYPYPVGQCDYCRWWKECDDKRLADDHLSLIAGIRLMHIGELEKQEIKGLEQFAGHDMTSLQKPERGSRDAFQKIHLQAKIQLKAKNSKQPEYELLDPVAEKGLTKLPEPSFADIYFDIEGNPYCFEQGLEYILGYAVKDAQEFKYFCHKAFSTREEKDAFETFIDFAIKRWESHPEMFIYHFGHYEPTTIKKLASKHGTREVEVDKLLRAKRFVDLYSIFKEGVRAGVERYSLKDLEAFTGYKRTIELRSAAIAKRQVEQSLQLNLVNDISDTSLQAVINYNYDDCIATAMLHIWLEERLTELKGKCGDFPRPELKIGDASEKVVKREEEVQKIYDQLRAGVNEDPEKRTQLEIGKILLSNIIDYFRREDRCSWWEFFRLIDLDDEDLIDERKTLVGIFPSGTVGGTAKVPIDRYTFPSQEVFLKDGSAILEVRDDKIVSIGTVARISLVENYVDMKKTQKTATYHPTKIVSRDQIPLESIEKSLLSFARGVMEYEEFGEGPYVAGRELLFSNPPKLTSGSISELNDKAGDRPTVAIEASNLLKASVLAIQGPPGSGKSTAGAKMIVDLARSGKKVGVLAPNHKVIRELLLKAVREATKINVKLEAFHKTSDKNDRNPDGFTEKDSNKDAINSIDAGRIVGGTGWLWSREDAVGKLDYLFIDEAGQMSLAMALAASRSTRNIILLGDPQQLEQPQKGSHPEGADVAALNHIIGDHDTIPVDKGIFLDFTYRLHPKITDFTSEIYYEGKLKSAPGLERQKILGKTYFEGSGLFYVPVEHRGNQNRSDEEVDQIVKIVQNLCNGDVTWTDKDNVVQSFTSEHILIVAPYNAQVAALKDKLPNCKIGTVDKFQGQEAPVVIYSMTSSSAEDAPRGMGFLYNPNRLNVATSRALSTCILVGTSAILKPNCHSIDQMRWANAFCRYSELATVISL